MRAYALAAFTTTRLPRDSVTTTSVPARRNAPSVTTETGRESLTVSSRNSA